MWIQISKFVATRAATGWALAVGLSLATAAWFAYDHRGDEIADLKLSLADCKGSARQAEVIEQLLEELRKQEQAKADEKIQRIEDLPDDCYYLDGPSPLDRVLQDPFSGP